MVYPGDTLAIPNPAEKTGQIDELIKKNNPNSKIPLILL